jgi:hypothetical protein
MAGQGREDPKVTDKVRKAKLEQKERDRLQEALRQQREREQREHPERWPEMPPVQQAGENPKVTARLEGQKREQQGRERTDQSASSNEGEGQDTRPWWRKIFGR